MPRSASAVGLAKRGVIPRKQFYINLLFFNTVILVFLVETSSAALESVRSTKYFDSHSKERAVKNTVRGLFLFPSTLASRVSVIAMSW